MDDIRIYKTTEGMIPTTSDNLVLILYTSITGEKLKLLNRTPDIPSDMFERVLVYSNNSNLRGNSTCWDGYWMHKYEGPWFWRKKNWDVGVLEKGKKVAIARLGEMFSISPQDESVSLDGKSFPTIEEIQLISRERYQELFKIYSGLLEQRRESLIAIEKKYGSEKRRKIEQLKRVIEAKRETEEAAIGRPSIDDILQSAFD